MLNASSRSTISRRSARLSVGYAPPQLQKHADVIARLERADRVQTPVPHGKRLTETARSLRGSSVS